LFSSLFAVIVFIMGNACTSRTEPKCDAGTATPEMRCDKLHRQLSGKVKEAGENWQDSVQADKVKPTSDTHLFKEHQKLLADAGATNAESVGVGFGPGDALVIVDMQNDFLPADVAPLGGKFGVAEGGVAAEVIVKLIKAAAKGGAKIVATRDYHPKNHCSFLPNGGHFPPHCVQGSAGSFLYAPIEKALKEVKEEGAGVSIVFKGFAPQCDSFGSFTYTKEYFAARQLGPDPVEQIHSCCAVDWTGCFCLPCSNMDDDLNAPPDVLAVFDRVPLKEHLGGQCNRLFGVGLALDFCVMDTLLNAQAAGFAKSGTYLLADAARAAYVPGLGTFGTGFLSDPEELVKKMKASGVEWAMSDKLLANKF